MLDSIDGIILAILSLGFIIFIHELGHFLAARRCGIRVEKFSIGFGPKLIGFKRGDTEYCISIIPFGGFVKMPGENPEERTGAPDEFYSAPVSRRIFVAVAGPLMNFLLGIILFSLVFLSGLKESSVRLIEMLTDAPLGRAEQATQIGLVAVDGPASISGIQPGDTIISINGNRVKSWQDFHLRIVVAPEEELEVLVSRDGEFKTLHVTPEKQNRKGMGEIGQIKVSSKEEVMVTSVTAGSPAAEAGVQANDLIETINGEKIYHVPDFTSQIWQPAGWIASSHQTFYKSIKSREDGKVSLGLRRGNESLIVDLPVDWTVTAVVEKNSDASEAGIETGDQIIGIQDKSINQIELYTRLSELVQSNPDRMIDIHLLRKGEELIVPLYPKLDFETNQSNLHGLHWKMSMSGLKFAAPPIPIPEYNFISALAKGLDTHWLILKMVIRVLKRLIVREVSPKFLSGPVGIVDATSRVLQIGLSSLLFFIGFISVNLGIVNLLPIPIADGGLILFFCLEKIRGKPLSIRKQMIIQQVSIVLIIGLFLYITWFDIQRLIPKPN